MNKTIWIINQFAGTPESGWGERHYYFSKYWTKKGYDVKIISGSYNHLFINQPKTYGKKITIEEVEKGISFCWVRIPEYDGGGIVSKLWANIVFAFNCIFLSTKQLGKPNVIIVSSPPIFSSIVGWYWKGKTSAKYSFEVRDLWPLTPMYLKGYSKWHPVIVVMALFEKIGYRKADYNVSVLSNSGSYINKISKNSSKFKWIPNGIDESLLESEDLPDEIIDKIPKDKFVVGYAGTMGMANALEYFTEAAVLMNEEYKKIHFVLVGEGYLKTELQMITKENTNITFVPKISKNQVQSMLALFDLCFIGRNNTPLFDYGVSSNKYFDYMLARKPILVSSRNIKDPVELSNCGLVVSPENAVAIKEGILKFYNMPDNERGEMSLRGYNYVKKYHNFKYLSDKYVDLF